VAIACAKDCERYKRRKAKKEKVKDKDKEDPTLLWIDAFAVTSQDAVAVTIAIGCSSPRGAFSETLLSSKDSEQERACSSCLAAFFHNLTHSSLIPGLNRSHDIAVQQLHHLGLEVSLELGPCKGLKGPSSSAAGDPAAAAVDARQLATYVILKVRVEQSLVEAEPRSPVWHLGHVAHVDHQREVVVVFSTLGFQLYT
jgi:hypothetical protein